MSELLGRRCAMGCQSWPDDEAYATCPICEELTRLYRGINPLSEKDAASLANKANFERYYEHEHVQDNDPLTDEELAAMGI